MRRTIRQDNTTGNLILFLLTIENNRSQDFPWCNTCSKPSQAPNTSLTEFLECLVPVPATVKNVGMFIRVYSCLTVSTCSLHSYSFKAAGRLSRILQIFKEQVPPLWIWLLISRILEMERKNSLPSCGTL